MITSVKVRNLILGQGRPKICVPIVGQTREEIAQAAEEIRSLPAELVEWRADWFEALEDEAAVIQVLEDLRERFGEERAILFTIRTQKEGGQGRISLSRYQELNLAALQTDGLDLVDVELSAGQETAAAIVEAAHRLGKKVIMSSHDFYRTPEVEEMIGALKRMQEWNADIPKLAVMPKSRMDVLKLLTATLTMREQYADRPMVTMAMAAEGTITRLAGETFGSCITFGCASKASAPGQIEVEQLHQVLEIIHNSMST